MSKQNLFINFLENTYKFREGAYFTMWQTEAKIFLKAWRVKMY